MEAFLKQLLADGDPMEVVDLCLDRALVRERHPEKFRVLEGLAAFGSLTDLSVSMHAISSLSGLPSLADLLQLNLSQNELVSLMGFPRQDCLVNLDLSLNQIESLKGLPDFPQLRELHLAFNQLENLLDFPSMARLRVLTLSGNRKLRRLTGLRACPALEELYLYNCYLSDWNSISDLLNLSLLYASPANPLTLSPLLSLNRLQFLRLSGKRMPPEISLPPFSKIRHFALNGGHLIKKVSGLHQFSNLKELDLANNALEEIPDLTKLKKLKSLNISHNPISSLNGITDLPSLETIFLSNTKLDRVKLGVFRKMRPEVEIR